MGYRESQRRSRELERSMVLEGDDPLEIGFTKSFTLAAEQFVAENTTRSEDRAVERFYGERNAELDLMIEAGEIPQDIAREYRESAGYNRINGMPKYEPAYHALAGWANENLSTEFDVDDTEMRQVMAAEREQRERRLARGSALGEFAGNAWGSLQDPAVLAATVATLPVTYGTGGSLGSLVLRAALTEGVIGMATEAPIQLDVMDFKKRIDSPYTVDDAIENVLAAGAGAAVLGGAGAGIGRFIEARLRGAPDDVTPDEALAAAVRTELETNRPEVPRFDPPEDVQGQGEVADEFAEYLDLSAGDEGRTFGDMLPEIDAEEAAFDEKLQKFLGCMEPAP